MDSQTIDYYNRSAQSQAESWESVASPLLPLVRDLFEEARSPAGLSNPRLLDIGCGSGRDLASYHRIGLDCTGLDPSRALLQEARTRHPE